MRSVKLEGLYRHFKGGYYQVIDTARDCTTDKLYVVYYDALWPDYNTFIRPFHDFFAETDSKGVSIINRKDNVTGQKMRFEKIERDRVVI